MSVVCTGGDCSGTLPTPLAWRYYPGDQSSFPAPTTALPTCSQIPTPTAYQESIAACVQTPLACNSTAVNIDTTNYGAARNFETAEAVNCLTHATTFKGDRVISTNPPSAPFQFIAGDDNPIALANPALAGQDVMVSDSLVTVPVFDVGPGPPPYPAPTNPVTILGFVQLFLNPGGRPTPNTGQVRTTVINMVGCGTNVSGPPILGNGASPVAVRLISPP